MLRIDFKSLFNKKNQLRPLKSGTLTDVFLVEECQDNKVIFKGKTRIVIYLSSYEFTPGDQIEATIELKQLSSPAYAGDFDEKTYYMAKGVTNRAILKSYKIIGHHFTIHLMKLKLQNFYKDRLGDKNYQYLRTLVFGENSLEDSVKTSYRHLYSTHLLAISGLHIVLIFRILRFLFQKFFHIESTLLSLLILGGYLVLIGFPASACRAYLFLALGWINKGEIVYTKLDILSISLIAMVIINPLLAYQQGFILSFLVSFLLLFMNEFQDYKGIKGKCITSLICIFSTIPFIINQAYELSITGLFLSFIVSFVLSSLLIPFVFFTLIIPIFYFEYFFIGIDRVLLYLEQFKLIMPMPAFSFPKMIFYYCLFFLWLMAMAKKKRRIVYFFVLISYLFSLALFVYGKPYYKVTFIDVGQGDSILIQTPYLEETILIDSYSNLDYLKSIAVKKIDYVILSHLDIDHFGTIQEVVTLYHPKKIFCSVYAESEKLDEMSCEVVPLRAETILPIGDMTIEILGPLIDYNDSNANSLVCKLNLGNTSIMFTGDMTIEAEEDLVSHYNKRLQADILKVGHHGSATSSSSAFITAVNPSVSIISVGEDNKYQLPNPEVYERITKKSKTFMTKDTGNIDIFIMNRYCICPYRK